MSTLDDRRLLEKLYLPSADDFVLVDVPDLQFVMLDGEGDPGGETFAQASRWLFSAIYPIKRVARERMGKSFVEPPLEALCGPTTSTTSLQGTEKSSSGG
jgi:hypothetical protein